jgi:hypothetical protein
VNEYKRCWFSGFGFPRENSLCNVYIFHCISFVFFIENMFVVNNCTRLKYTILCLNHILWLSFIRSIVFNDMSMMYFVGNVSQVAYACH